MIDPDSAEQTGDCPARPATAATAVTDTGTDVELSCTQEHVVLPDTSFGFHSVADAAARAAWGLMCTCAGVPRCVWTGESAQSLRVCSC